VEKNLDHRPDEYARIGDMVTLAKVFARLCVSEDVGKDRP
jgi:acetylornithine deacetylase/succinyl-diaminopimelate desuccinylase-like protein